MKWLSFPGTPALKNPEQWLSTTGQVAQPGAENPSSVVSKLASPPHDKLSMFNLSTVVEPTCCTTQKYRLLYTIKYGTIQPMMKSGILLCAYAARLQIVSRLQ